jgi:hypothetical protein
MQPRRGPGQPHLREVVREKKQTTCEERRMEAPVALLEQLSNLN